MLALTPASSSHQAGLAFLASEPQAASLVRQRFGPLVNRMSRRALGHDADVEDIEQEVFLRVFSGISRLRQPESLRMFVLTVTKRTVGREVRRRRVQRQVLVSDEGTPADPVGDIGSPAAYHAYCRLRALVGRLRERDRRAFVLRFVVGMDGEEVAEALGVSVPTARRSFLRALSRVRGWALHDAFLGDYLANSPSEIR